MTFILTLILALVRPHTARTSACLDPPVERAGNGTRTRTKRIGTGRPTQRASKVRGQAGRSAEHDDGWPLR